MNRKTIQGLENYFGPIPTAFKIGSPYGADHHYIQPWWILYVSSYQRNNLLQLLNLILDNSGPFSSLNTGTWVYELSEMLAKPVLEGTRVVTKHTIDEDDVTNLSKFVINDKIVEWLAKKISKVDNVSMEEATRMAMEYFDA